MPVRHYAACFLVLLNLVMLPGLCAEKPSIGTPGRVLVFTETFDHETSIERGLEIVPAFTVEGGVLVGTQKRDKTVPGVDGKPDLRAHPAVYGFEVPTTDCEVATRINFKDASMIEIAWDDVTYTGSSHGHICRVQLFRDRVLLLDERDGLRSNTYRDMPKDASSKEKRTAFLAGRSEELPVSLEAGRWYDVVVTIRGDEMQARIDGNTVAQLKSSGIAHPTKARICVGVAGRAGLLDDFRVWRVDDESKR